MDAIRSAVLMLQALANASTSALETLPPLVIDQSRATGMPVSLDSLPSGVAFWESHA